MDEQTEDAIAYLINYTKVTPMTYIEGKRHYDSAKRLEKALHKMDARVPSEGIGENPCKEWFEKLFEESGYESKEPCWMCGSTGPTKSEPRFGYVACKKCCDLSPVRFNNAPYRPD